jgi:hypothetical protein
VVAIVALVNYMMEGMNMTDETNTDEIRTALHLALIKGRHETPATDWVFDAIEDVHDYDAMNKRAGDYLHETAGEGLEFGMLLDVYLYVTGLSSALVATLKAWEEYEMRYFGHQLTLMHYDRDTDSYKAQPWWDGFKWGE